MAPPSTHAIELGFDRVLTSGGTPRAIDGVEAVADLHRQAAGRIIILAGSGVSPQSLPALLRTGITEVHAIVPSADRRRCRPGGRAIRFRRAEPHRDQYGPHPPAVAYAYAETHA
ncbi:copper homeostasis protein CutC [Sphingomonas aerolata]|uniref:copper homeostasis protein CutC n=1 Tax=Sphingomonas aerolata TaxID=185951 RepID=UPI002FE0BFFA